MSHTKNARYKYMPDAMGQEEFLSRFVVRQEVFEEVFEELQEADYSVHNQHYIMIGQRGQGKTTLLRKLKIEVEKDKKLSKFLIPVKFDEEQYRVRQLCRLWEEVAGYLQTYHEDVFASISDEIEQHIDDANYHDACFSYLEKAIKKHKKKLLLLIDNIDVLLGKLKEKEQHQLREIMLTSSSFVIVGGSTRMFEQQYDYSKPFYEFFKIIRLESLSYEESIALLRAIGDEEQSARIEEIIQHTPERIETLRRITGGVPRTIVMLFDIFVEDNSNAFGDLMKVLDEATPLYKDRMDSLPPVLQEIVDTIALNWDGMSTKEIAQRTRLESKVVSAQLKQLEKYQIIDSESVGKNKIYILKERFFNIWYLMRYGRKKDRNRVEWLIKFLVSWYNRDELANKTKQLINSMRTEAHAYRVEEEKEGYGLAGSREGGVYVGAVALLSLEDFSKSYEKFLEWLSYDNAVDSEEDVMVYLTLLIAKGQLYKAKEFMEFPEYQLKERYKPIWYALMTLMQDDFPIEIKKMGSELKETVDEVLAHIEEMRVKYAVD